MVCQVVLDSSRELGFFSFSLLITKWIILSWRIYHVSQLNNISLDRVVSRTEVEGTKYACYYFFCVHLCTCYCGEFWYFGKSLLIQLCKLFLRTTPAYLRYHFFFYTTKGLKKYVHTLGLKVTNCYIFLRPVVDDVWIASQR